MITVVKYTGLYRQMQMRGAEAQGRRGICAWVSDKIFLSPPFARRDAGAQREHMLAVATLTVSWLPCNPLCFSQRR